MQEKFQKNPRAVQKMPGAVADMLDCIEDVMDKRRPLERGLKTRKNKDGGPLSAKDPDAKSIIMIHRQYLIVSASENCRWTSPLMVVGLHCH